MVKNESEIILGKKGSDLHLTLDRYFNNPNEHGQAGYLQFHDFKNNV